MKKLFKVLLLFIFILLFFIIFSQKINATTPNEYYWKTVYITKNGSKYHLSGCDYLDSKPFKRYIGEIEAARIFSL